MPHFDLVDILALLQQEILMQPVALILLLNQFELLAADCRFILNQVNI